MSVSQGRDANRPLRKSALPNHGKIAVRKGEGVRTRRSSNEARQGRKISKPVKRPDRGQRTLTKKYSSPEEGG